MQARLYSYYDDLSMKVDYLGNSAIVSTDRLFSYLLRVEDIQSLERFVIATYQDGHREYTLMATL